MDLWFVVDAGCDSCLRVPGQERSGSGFIIRVQFLRHDWIDLFKFGILLLFGHILYHLLRDYFAFVW